MSYKHIALNQIPNGHPVKGFDDYWRLSVPSKMVTNWTDFKPFDLPKIIPWILLLTKDSITDIYSYSVCGTKCEEIFGRSFQNNKFGEGLPSRFAAKRLKEFNVVASGNGPIYSKTNLPIEGREHVSVFCGTFAYRTDNDINKIVVVIAPEDERTG